MESEMAIIPVARVYESSVELEEFGSSIESSISLVESQKELLHTQIDQLQKIVITQCKFTGANPLSEDMAVGALSVKIGKRPKGLLNPEAIQYMQSVFAIKDTIGKKEANEISALFGITVTQIRSYFSNLRARVRKLIRLSQNKETNFDAPMTITDGCSSKPEVPEEVLALRSAEDCRDSEPNKTLKLLTGSSDASTRKHGRNELATKTKEHRKVLLVEQPDSKPGRSSLTTREVPSNRSRSLSADDIQKAKIQASFKQDKCGKGDVPATCENNPPKTEDHKNSLTANKLSHLSPLRRNRGKVTLALAKKRSELTPRQQLVLLKKNLLQWYTPPEVRVNTSWRVGAGDESKELHTQFQRIQRENETIYLNLRDIPLNPREPWDQEIDYYDDTLTPKIPIELDLDSSTIVKGIPTSVPEIDEGLLAVLEMAKKAGGKLASDILNDLTEKTRARSRC